jgi:hypothetical protein
MRQFIWAGLVPGLFATGLCSAVLAQTTPAPPVTTPPPPGAQPPSGGPGTPPMTEPANKIDRNGLSPGANALTEAQARSRLERNGYARVSDLKKDDDGVWRGSAMKNGSTTNVAVDYRGNISTGDAGVPRAPN